MTQITYEYLVSGSASYVKSDNTAINVTVKFDHLDEEVLFTADQNDLESHGVTIFNACVAGDAGAVAAYVELD